MEVTSAKVLDSGRKVLLDLKRKRADPCLEYFNGAAYTDAQMHGQTDVCKNSFRPNVMKSLPKNYSNFMKSGLPQRVLLFENGEWTDFPKGFIGLLEEDFRMKKVPTEVEFRGSPSLVDFLHMSLLDLETGLQKPIAWIDKGGNCYFPEPHFFNDELPEGFQSEGMENHHLLYSEPNDTHGIKLQLEIEVTRDANLKIGECSEGSNTDVKRLKTGGKTKPVTSAALDQEASNDGKPVHEIQKVTSEYRPFGSPTPKNPIAEVLKGKVTSDIVKYMFIKGMGPSICADYIHGIQRTSGVLAQDRLELFKKQAEITGKCRSNANVRFAWLGSSKEAVSRILIHGLGFNELLKTKPIYGTGVHVTALSCPHISAKYCDVDENGVQHMVLCRVILGNMELVHPGSEQSYPSSENFDSGVNDLINPEHYIIWNMNLGTHIYPEYVVSFKRPPSSKGQTSERGSEEGVSCVTTSTACQGCSLVDSVRDSPQTRRCLSIKTPPTSFFGCLFLCCLQQLRIK